MEASGGGLGCVLVVVQILVGWTLPGGSSWGAVPNVAPGLAETVSPSVDRLSTIHQVRELSPGRAEERPAVQVEGVFTLVDPARHMCFVEDDTGGVYVQGAADQGYRTGQRVRITGSAELGRFTPYLRYESIEVLGEEALRPGRRISVGAFRAGFYEGERVAVEGRVTRQEAVEDRWRLRLLNSGESIMVWLPREVMAEKPVDYLHARMRVHGVCAGVFNERGEVVDFHLHAGAVADGELLDASVPALEVQELGLGDLEADWNEVGMERVRCHGWVTLHWPGHYLFITDGRNSLEVRADRTEVFQAGDEVAVLGFRTLAHRRMILTEATVRRLGHRALPPPMISYMERIRSRHSHGESVAVEGEVVEVSGADLEGDSPSGTSLLLRQGQRHLRVMFPPGSTLPVGSGTLLGSHVRASGVLAAQQAPSGEALTYRLLLNSPDHLEVLRRASWWNLRRAVLAMGGTGVILVAALGWGMGFSQLRRRRAEQSIRRHREKAIQHRDAMLELTRMVQKSRDQAPLPAITELVARTLGETRVSVWRLDDTRQELRCLDLFDGKDHTSGQVLTGDPCRAYFAALNEFRIIAADDARSDPRTREITSGYLDPNGILSMLDVPLHFQGRVDGVLCIERTGQRREWEMEEQDFAAAVGDQLSLLREANERERTERELRAAHSELEIRVLLRTTELAEARDRAEAADRLKSAFLATMSHELRTPLNSIIGFTGILLQGLVGALNPEQKKQLGMVQNSARHLLSLINDVLDISKIEAGQVEVHRSSFEVRDVTRRVMDLLMPAASKKGLDLCLEVDPEVGTLVSDMRRVEQVLINLVNNAIKFTEQGEVRLVVRRTGAQLAFRVSDTGIGIQEDQRDKLFRPFQQLDTGLARRHEGTGLGLAICAGLAKMLEGTLTVESELGRGSTFTFTVPNGGHAKP